MAMATCAKDPIRSWLPRIAHPKNPNSIFRSHNFLSMHCKRSNCLLSLSLYPVPVSGSKGGPVQISATSSHDPGHFPLPFYRMQPLKLHLLLVQQLAASAILFISLGAQASTSGRQLLPLTQVTKPLQESFVESVGVGAQSAGLDSENLVSINSAAANNVDDTELKAAFERWKSKTYALTVPMRIVALRGSVPPSWIKDFIRVQGRRLKLQVEFRGCIEDIFADLSLASRKGHIEPKSAMAADMVTIGDSWLDMAISKGIIEPLDVEGLECFSGLDDKWKIYLRRNGQGNLDSSGGIWGVPYRWGSMVIAYKKNKFQMHNLDPIEDWSDLWRPELAGKISMVDAPREVVGMVLKYMGASYNTKDIDMQVEGGLDAVMNNLETLQRQVLLFDSKYYLKAFGTGDAWVAVGWSSDVIPVAKRLSSVAVVVPKSGTSLWADLWAVPAATTFGTSQIGGRVRSPCPLIHQWIEFCLQTSRALPFEQEVVPGSSPLAYEDFQIAERSQDLHRGNPKLDKNLIGGIPPPAVLARCEFLEPLSEKALIQYQLLIAGMQKKGQSRTKLVLDYMKSAFQKFGFKPYQA